MFIFKMLVQSKCTIEIDFDVFKKLPATRETKAMTYNDVLRKMFGLGQLVKLSDRST